jgi:hypothetical protein
MSVIVSNEIEPDPDKGTMVWVSASVSKLKEQKGAIIFADMADSTPLWEMISECEKQAPGLAIRDQCWEIIRGAQNTVLGSFLDAGPFGCSLIKGLGDGFIFHTDQVQIAYSCAKQADVEARKFVKEELAGLAESVKSIRVVKNDVPRSAENIEHLHPSTKTEKSLGDALDSISFRFVVHWTDNVIAADLYMADEKGKLWLDYGTGLISVEHADGKTEAPIIVKEPYYPDLFGHDMNYVARCINVAKKSGIYLTDKAVERIANEQPIPQLSTVFDDYRGPRVPVSVKGLNAAVAFRQVSSEISDFGDEATIDHYKTKALLIRNVHQHTGHPSTNKIFLTVKNLIRGLDKDHKRLHPHIFTVLLTEPSVGLAILISDTVTAGSPVEENSLDKSPKVILRLEGPDQEYLENILASPGGLNWLLDELDLPPGGTKVTERFDTETRFIRTTNDPDHQNGNIPARAVQKQKWARMLAENHTNHPFLYVEVSVDSYDDIDVIAQSLIHSVGNHAALGGFTLVELCRLWGKPAIYFILETRDVLQENIANRARKIADYIKIKTKSFLKDDRNRPLKDENRTLKDKIRIEVRPCQFASASFEPEPLTEKVSPI